MFDGLSDAEKARLERLARTRRNIRGRRQPAVLPSKLARTSAFAPRRHGLSSDADFLRVYVVRPHAVVEVRGRELGTRHRDALIALFRLRARRFETVAADGRTRTAVYRTDTTWRQILLASGLTAHVNNLLVALRVFEELRSVTVRVFTGSFSAYETAVARGRLASAGWSDGLIGTIEWSGVSLDSEVSVAYGEWVRMTFEAKNLVSVSADVYFRLKGDFSRAWWPYIDSQPDHDYVPLETLSALIGRDYRTEDSKRRARFREDVVSAFQDLVRAGGIEAFELVAYGPGRTKSYRVRYRHALPKAGQLELAIGDAPRRQTLHREN
ncbi:MAG: hypothetical protein JO264_07850 [Acidisphaera sp.]|nr:hypothetical protein [Acidisphaera sp.]